LAKEGSSPKTGLIWWLVLEKKNPFSEASKQRRKLLNERNSLKSPSSKDANVKKRDLDKEARIDLKRKDNLSPKGLYV